MIVSAGEQRTAALRGCGEDHQIPGKTAQFTQKSAHILAAVVKLAKKQQGVLRFLLQDKAHQLRRLNAAGQTQHLQHLAAADGAADHPALIQQAQRVPQSTVGHAGEDLRAVRLEVNGFLFGDVQKALGDVLGHDALEGKPLTAGENGGGHLVQLRGGQNEQQMLRRLFQNLQKSVEGGQGQHMDFVDDIHPLFQHGGGIDGLFPQGTDVLHAVVGGGVQLRYIQQTAVVNAAAGLAFVAGGAVHRVQAVHRLGQDPGAGGLAGAAGAGEQIGMAHLTLGHLLLQRVGDMRLSHHVGKGFWPPFAVQCLIHTPTSLKKYGNK